MTWGGGCCWHPSALTLPQHAAPPKYQIKVPPLLYFIASLTFPPYFISSCLLSICLSTHLSIYSGSQLLSLFGFVFLCAAFMIRQASPGWTQRQSPHPAPLLHSVPSRLAPPSGRRTYLPQGFQPSPGLSLFVLVGLLRSSPCGQINIMLLIGEAWISHPPPGLKTGVSFPSTTWTENEEGNLGDCLKTIRKPF